MIDDLTIAELRELGSLFLRPTSSLKTGANYFIRTGTYHYIGTLRTVNTGELVLSDASWVADSGRWNKALTTGELSEVEPYPDDVVISRSAVVDVTVWRHALPREVK
jgi:uridine phosphorylase